MQKYARILSYSLFLLVLETSAALAGKRFALVVGVNVYDNLPREQQLQRAVNDVRALSAALSPLNFEVTVAEDVGRGAFNRTWQAFLNKIGPEDTAAVFFSGHGVELGGLNYLLPRDVPAIKAGEEGLLRRESLAVADLIADLRDRNPQVSLIVLDACRDNPFKRPGQRSIGGTRGLAAIQPAEGAFVMYSAGQGETALDRLSDADPVPTSVYMRHLLPLLAKSGLSLPEIAQQVRRDVRETVAKVNHKQSPAYYDEVIGRFCLAGCEMQVAVGPKLDEDGKRNPQPAPDLAVASAARAIAVDPQDAEAFYTRGRALHDKKDYDAAIADYSAALKLDLGHVRALAGRGQAFLDKKQFDKAIADFTAAIQLDPRDVRSINARGWAYEGKKDYDRAVADFSEAVRINPKYSLGYRNRGIMLAFRKQERDLDAGIADFSEAIRLSPKTAYYYVNRGEAFANKGDYAQALADYERAIALDPKSGGIAGRADIYLRKGEIDRAIAEYDAALALAATSRYALNGRGLAHAQKGNFDLAIADFNAAIKTEPDNVQPWVNRGRVHARKGDAVLALADFDAAVRIDPQSMFALLQRGRYFARKGDFDHALADLNVAVRLAPKSAEARRGRGYAYAEKGDKERAMADLDEAVRLVPDATSYNSRAWGLFKLGEVTAGLPDVEKSIALNPKNANAYDTRAHIHEAMGRHDDAIADYRRALALSPALEASIAGLKRLGLEK